MARLPPALAAGLAGVVTAALVAAAAASPVASPPGACAEGLELGGGEAVALLQTGGRQLRRQPAAQAPALPTLRPWGHSYFSTDPEASAKYFTRYFRRARLVRASSGFAEPCGGDAAVVQYCPREGQPCMVVTFVNDLTKPTGPLHPSLIVNATDAEWDRVANETMRHHSTYSPWLDFHDGWRGEDFDSRRALQDGLGYEFYGNVLRLALPGTMWTLELHSYDRALRTESVVKSPDVCRDTWFDIFVARETSLEGQGNGWWKATFGAVDPGAAAAFAVEALGAAKIAGPFPDPPREECVYAQWVVLPDGLQGLAPDRPSGFMLHFVQQPKSAWPGGNVTIEAFAQMQEQLRDLEAGVFDAYLYNSLILWADDLDPYVERFRLLKVPFLALRADDGSFAVFVSVPGNGIPLQLRSRTLTAAEPREANVCW